MIDQDLLARWGWAGAAVEPLPGGLINTTYVVARGGVRHVLQRLHPVFGPEVNLDLEAVSAHVAARGLETPRLVRTADGEPHVLRDDGCWRALTFLDGVTLHAIDSPGRARSAAALAGRFHRAAADCDWRLRFTRAGVHDTARHLANLRRALDEHRAHPLHPRVAPLGEAILADAARTVAWAGLPPRLVHGDLKVSNVLFDAATGEARALIDLDTLARLPVPVELGDAFRSWCNPAGEDTEETRFDLDVFAAAAAGYAAAAPLAPDERDALVPVLHTLCVELAARFAADALDERYFGWDPARYPRRGEHNRVRAAGQLALARAVEAARAGAEGAVRAAFA